MNLVFTSRTPATTDMLTPFASSADDTTPRTVALHVFVPPHTPQLSTAAVQHTPEGGSGVEQHLPRTSSTMPLPPHTPHASNTPEAQHLPSRSTTAPVGQQRPVMASMTLRQHVPAASTTPAVQASVAALLCCSAIVRQSVPAQPR